MKKFRLFSQALFFTVFIYIFFNTLIDNTIFGSEFELKGRIDYLFAVDPLLGLTTLLSTYKLSSIFILSTVTVLLTLIFGRFFCGWVCPMGSLLHFFSYLAEKMKFYNKSHFKGDKFLPIKYYILLFIILLSIFQINISGYLDPLSLLVKVMSIFIIPVIYTLYNMQILPFFVQDYIFNNITGREVIYYNSAYLFGIIFFVLIFLNFLRSRFWCRYLCPLGALLGAISTFSFFKIQKGENCINCGVCDEKCYANATPSKNDFSKRECMLLFNCIKSCKNSAISYKYNISFSKFDINRRLALKTFGFGLGTILILKLKNYSIKNEKLIRPPGAMNEEEFLKTCIRCGACMKVCPENFLSPAIAEGGILDLFTPVANAKYGYCIYNCNLCTKVCPTGAIKRLTVDEKQKFTIGTAYIDKNRCLPHAFDTNCAVCEEHCPTSPKAITFETVQKEKNGEEFILRKPIVNPTLCIGCGICQYKCPVNDKYAVYITSIKNGGLLINNNSGKIDEYF